MPFISITLKEAPDSLLGKKMNLFAKLTGLFVKPTDLFAKPPNLFAKRQIPNSKIDLRKWGTIVIRGNESKRRLVFQAGMESDPLIETVNQVFQKKGSVPLLDAAELTLILKRKNGSHASVFHMFKLPL